MNATYLANHVDTGAVYDLLSTKRVDTNARFTHRFGLDGIDEETRLSDADDASIKSIICLMKDFSQNHN
jgi:hypothetical protein